MDYTRVFLVIVVGGIVTYLERALPFILFRNGKIPPVVEYLGKVLPLAIMTTLVIYCIRGMEFSSAALFVPQLAGVLATVVIHLWKNNSMVSIVGGTAVYMVLLNLL